MGLLFREHQRLIFVVVFEEVRFLVYKESNYCTTDISCAC